MKIVFRCDPALIDHLPRPIPAREVLPDWLRRLPPRVPSAVHGRSIRTVKQCPPFVDAMQHGFVLTLPCDLVVEPGGRIGWDWPLPLPELDDHPRSPLSFHVPEQIAGSPLERGPHQSAIKFNSFWTITLEPDWSLMAVHPIHRDDLPFRTVTGLVDADRFNAVGINFPAVWVDPDYTGTLPRGTPFVQCYPVRREPAELVCEPMADTDRSNYRSLATAIMAGPGTYRKGYRRKLGDGR